MPLARLSILVLFLLLVVVPAAYLSGHVRDRALVNDEYRNHQPTPIQNFGSTKTLSILPLINWHTNNDSLSGEQGVAYLIKTDANTLLFDLGHNRDEASPSPLEHNMNKLQVSLSDVDTIFLSHNHFDHVGGKKWMQANSFSFGNKQVDLDGKRVFTPVAMTYPGIDPQHTPEPTKIAEGIASTGTIPRQLFIGRIDEQALVINVEGKGLVLIVGCGHQTVSKLIERTNAVFDQPIYGIIGDLHFPIPSGRLDIAGINAQKVFASGESPFRPLTQEQIDKDQALLKSLNLGVMALGGHDSSDEVISQFDQHFGENYQHVRVGDWIHVNSDTRLVAN